MKGLISDLFGKASVYQLVHWLSHLCEKTHRKTRKLQLGRNVDIFVGRNTKQAGENNKAPSLGSQTFKSCSQSRLFRLRLGLRKL